MDMLTCSSCFRDLPKEFFSKNQLRSKKNKCLHCTLGYAYPPIEDIFDSSGEENESAFYVEAFPVDGLSEEPSKIVLIDSNVTQRAYAQMVEDLAKAALVAFDAEWKPDRYKGSDNPVAVLQLACPHASSVYVIHVASFGIPTQIQELLESSVLKIGFATDRNDMHKFAISGICIDDQSIIDVCGACVDALNINKKDQLGLGRAAKDILDYDMNKSKAISCSNWARKKLTEDQVKYAGMDAWVTLRLYEALQKQ